MKCPHCFKAELVSAIQDVPYQYKGKITTIPKVQGEFCPQCGEIVTDESESRRMLAAMAAFDRQVNATYIEPSYIQAVRKKLNLDQRQAGELFGGGVNAFSRYETGKARPSVALIKLLKLLDKHPNLLAELS